MDLAKLMPVLTVGGGNQETTVPYTVVFGPAEHQSTSNVDTAREALHVVNDLEARGALIAYILTPGGGAISKANLRQMAEWETAHDTKRR